MNADDFSTNFSFEELTYSQSFPEMVMQNRQDAMRYIASGKKLSHLLEDIREILGGKAIKVNSGYRNTKLNKAVGSKSARSKHTVFEASDIKPLHISIQDAFDKLIEAHKAGLLPHLRKVLQEGSWLHVEVSTSAGDYRGFFVSKDGNKSFDKVA